MLALGKRSIYAALRIRLVDLLKVGQVDTLCRSGYSGILKGVTTHRSRVRHDLSWALVRQHKQPDVIRHPHLLDEGCIARSKDDIAVPLQTNHERGFGCRGSHCRVR